jgi:chemotaxis protein methyltransferase CheR
MSVSDKAGAAFESIFALVTAGTGLTVSPNRRWWAEDRVRRSMTRIGIADPNEFLRRLGDADDLDDFASELAVGETYFFRDAGQLEFIRREALPDIRSRRGWHHRLRAWSAGCASGEEAYTLAILFEQEGFGPDWELLGTDISSVALTKAARGHYAAWSFRGESFGAADSYFSRRSDGVVVARRLADRISWRRLNLATCSYPSPSNGTAELDLILCRNVLIYFEPDMVRAVQERLFAALAEGGWLVLGPSDPPMPAIEGCESVVSKAGIFYRRRRRTDEPATSCTPTIGSCLAPHGQAVPAERPSRRWEDEAATGSPVRAAASAHEAGDAVLAEPASDQAADCALRVRTFARRGDAIAAARAVADGIAQFPLFPELHHLHSILLLGLGDHEEAARAVRRVIYLDRNLAFGHVTLAMILQRIGRTAEAARSYRYALTLLARQPPDSVVPLSEGQTSRLLTESVNAQLSLLAGIGSHAHE